jgi:hypothetical protein
MVVLNACHKIFLNMMNVNFLLRENMFYVVTVRVAYLYTKYATNLVTK